MVNAFHPAKLTDQINKIRQTVNDDICDLVEIILDT